MINRANWKKQKEYLQYRKEIDLLSPGSLKMEEGLMRHLLIWVDSVPFSKAPTIRPSFPEYLLSVRTEGGQKTLSPTYVKKLVRNSKRFFVWLSRQSGYRTISENWIDTLKPPRMTVEPIKRDVVTLEYIRQLALSPVETVREKRIRAAAVFWFLSGVRIGAFVTLPIRAINLTQRTVNQWPKLGVETKNKKHATTNLLNIPDLLEVVREWDIYVRGELPDDGLWFAPIEPETQEFIPVGEVGKQRHSRARKDLRDWVNRIGLPYYSPHKFRHGHATYSISNAVTVADLKAISQNLMHSSLTITDSIYAVLSDSEVSERIDKLGVRKTSIDQNSKSEIIAQVENLLSKLKETQ